MRWVTASALTTWKNTPGCSVSAPTPALTVQEVRPTAWWQIRRYKEKVYGEDWYLSETFDAAIGQGFQLATPIQMATVMGVIANGGQSLPALPCQSHGLSRRRNTIKTFSPEEVATVPISERTLNLIRSALYDVARPGGTAGLCIRRLSPSLSPARPVPPKIPHGDDDTAGLWPTPPLTTRPLWLP